MNLKIGNKDFNVEWEDSKLVNAISEKFPLEMKLDGRYGDELYALTNFGFELNSSAKEVFEIGDIVYWVKSDNSKEAIAIFFGNTSAGDGTQPRPVSKCSLIGKIVGECSIGDDVGKGENIKFVK